MILITHEMQWATRADSYLTDQGIQSLLTSFLSWLSAHDMDGVPFSKWLYEACMEAGIEPIMALAMLQKEQSLVQKWKVGQMPTQNTLDWACGFGAFEGSKPEDRDPEYKGFAKQIKLMLARWKEYFSWKCIINWKTTPIALYDDNGKTGEKIIAGNLETALHLLYNPRMGSDDGVPLLKNIWTRYYSQAERLGVLENGKGRPDTGDAE